MNNYPGQFEPTYGPRIPGDLKGPGIALIVTSILNAAVAFIELVSGLVRLAQGDLDQPIADEAERIGFYIGTVVAYGVGVLSLIVSPLILAGGIAMVRGKSEGLIRTAAILSMVPFTSCCCIVGIPVGIWALITLKKPEVQQYFRGPTPPPAGSTYG